jgi:tungstate transport system ATP-binding protein
MSDHPPFAAAFADVSKRFGARTILDSVSARFVSGESYVLTGDNGSGKSTLMRMLAGLDAADSGTIQVGAREAELRSYPEWLRREILYVHQHPYLFDTTIEDNVAYGLKVRSVDAATRRQRVEEAIEWAGLQPLVRSRPSRLSGGEKQRVAIARARVLDPKIILLDEPTANLDRDGRQMVIESIHNLVGGDSIVLVACHDPELIDLPYMHRLRLENGHLAVIREPSMRPKAYASLVRSAAGR